MNAQLFSNDFVLRTAPVIAAPVGVVALRGVFLVNEISRSTVYGCGGIVR